MTASRVEYAQDLLADCEIILKDYQGADKGTIIAALVLADSLNGLRKSILQQPGNPQKRSYAA